jgi:hypothetical protein
MTASYNLSQLGSNYLQGGSGSVARTTASKLQESVSVKDFGAVGNGVTDDTAAFNNARTAAIAAGVPLLIYGTLKITSLLTVSSKEHWIFQGSPGNSSGSLPTSYLIKAASVAGDLVTITASNTIIDGGGIVGVAGNTGNGYTILGNGVTLNYPYVYLCGNDGIRIGVDAGGDNCNSFTLYRPTCSSNGRRGIYINDGSLTIPANANSGTIFNPLMQNNGENGLHINTSAWVTVINPLAEANTGVGIYLDANAQVSIYDGDTEANTGANFTQVNPANNNIYRLSVNGFNYTSLLSSLPIASAINGRNCLQNGTFDSNSIWIFYGAASISGGVLTTPAGTQASQFFQTVVGNSYTLTVQITGASTRSIIRAGSTGPYTFDYVNVVYLTTTGTFSYTFVATTENTWVTLFTDVGASGPTTWDNVVVVGNITSLGSVSFPAPVTRTGTTYPVGTTDYSIIINGSATCTLTLPTASSYTGRMLVIKTVAAFTVVSAASNVVPATGGAAGTAILAATAGKFSYLQSDGTNWITMMAN